MKTSAATDARRAEVERWLHSVVSLGLAVPAAAASSVRRCLGTRLGPVTERVAEPVRVVRSIVELFAGGGAPAGGSEAESSTASGPVPAPAEAHEGTADGSQLPIEEYESLAASQVVARLSNLTAEELVAVRRFEVAHRARRTVLGRIDQLLAAAHDAEDAG